MDTITVLDSDLINPESDSPKIHVWFTRSGVEYQKEISGCLFAYYLRTRDAFAELPRYWYTTQPAERNNEMAEYIRDAFATTPTPRPLISEIKNALKKWLCK